MMDVRTRWVPNELGEELLAHCRPHVMAMDEDGPDPVMESLHVARPRWTELLRGKIGAHSVAMKVWRMRAHVNRVGFAQKLSRELDNWKRASAHPNVAPYFGVVSGFGHVPSLVQPFYTHGNIGDYLANHPNRNSLHMLCCVADGLVFMHSLTPPVTHGGIRGANILISDTGTPQLSDVSVCCIPRSFNGHSPNVRWMAPEVVHPPDSEQMSAGTPQSDVYSFGMTILEVLSGVLPYAHRRTDAQAIIDIVNGIRPSKPNCAKLTDPLWNVVQSCWKQHPAERPRMGTVRAWLHLICLIEGEGRAEPCS